MTTRTDLSGTTEIGNEGIKKHFKSVEPWQPIFELTWNGFDAKARTVAVDVHLNELDAPQVVTVLDDGEGIDPTTLKSTFGRFNDSQKRGDASQHGAHGRGRLSFHRICRHATWHTRAGAGQARIAVDAHSIKDYGAWLISDHEQCEPLQRQPTGTFVSLEGFSNHLPTHTELKAKLATEFGWHLALHAEHVLKLNGEPIAVPEHEVIEHRFSWDDLRFDAQIIRWHARPSSEKSYTYLLNSEGRVVYRQLSTLNNKSGFFTSISISSAWADSFAAEPDLFDPQAHTPRSSDWKRLMRELGELTQSIYERFLRQRALDEVEKYVDEGLFPTYTELPLEEREWRLNNAKDLVTAVYVADPSVFDSASKKQRKVIIQLLDRLSVSNENDALFDVLNSVLELDEKGMQTLADQLQQTSLENIISTIEILQRRHNAAAKLRTLMDVHYREVMETPDLQKIIEANTWLFGPAYETLGAEEDSFTKIARTLRDRVPLIDVIDDRDGESPEDIAGAKRQTDLFLARRIPSIDSTGREVYRCVIVEIKRPSVALNIKHLRQLEDYANIIKRHSQFSSELMRFELILLGRKISSEDMEIASRMNQLQNRGELGLVSDEPRMKRYVLNWYTLLDAFELSNTFLLKRLKLKRDLFESSTKEELVSELQTPH